jgi:hypothetical protein
MHDSPDHWHIQVILPTGETIERAWTPPQPVLPGVRRLAQLLLPRATVRYPMPKRSGRVIWYPAPPDAETWVEFTVLHCTEGIPDVKSAEVIGTTSMADGSVVMVLARHRPGESGQSTFQAADAEEAEAMKRQMRGSPGIGALIHGAYPDGCLWFLHLHATPPAAP